MPGLALWAYSGPDVPRPALPRRLCWLLAPALLLTACAGKGKGAAKPGESGAPAEGAEEAAATMKSAMNVEPIVPKRKVALIPLRADSQHCDIAGKRVLQQDLNQDGRADLITLTTAEDGKIRCRQADLDNDGRLDSFLHYDERGELAREQFDLDFDGRIDLGRTYKDGKIELDEQDLDHDGYVDAWRRYDKGRLTRVDHDRDGDGRPDTFTFFVRGQIDRVGYDTNGDGNVDSWDQDVARRAQAALARVQLSMARAPLGFARWLSALDLALAPPATLAIVGPAPEPLLRVARASYRPNLLVAAALTSGTTPEILDGRDLVGGVATAYLCRHFTCESPVTNPDKLAQLLRE